MLPVCPWCCAPGSWSARAAGWRDDTEHAVTDLDAFLRGAWSIERRLFDRASGASGTFRGTAVFTDDDDGGLVHDETGALRWADQPDVPTTRRLLWKPAERAAAMDVFFADGRPFHHLDLSTGGDQPTHPCSADMYSGTFHVLNDDAWSYQWTVTGPAKDLLLVSELRRLPVAKPGTAE